MTGSFRSRLAAPVPARFYEAASAMRRPWLLVPSTVDAQVEAIRELVRPDEVAHLAGEIDPVDVVWSISRWIRYQRSRGALRYIDDPISMDLWCSPDCTLASGGGDCEDFAILAASLLAATSSARVAVIVGLLDQTPHAWVEGRDRAGYFLLEATRGYYYDDPPPAYQPRRRFGV
jgi:transglutaminase-like putative cysteine protease